MGILNARCVKRSEDTIKWEITKESSVNIRPLINFMYVLIGLL